MLWHKGAIVVAEMSYAQEVKPPELAGRELGMLSVWYGFVHFNSNERGEFTSILTSYLTSEISIVHYIHIYEKNDIVCCHTAHGNEPFGTVALWQFACQ